VSMDQLMVLQVHDRLILPLSLPTFAFKINNSFACSVCMYFSVLMFSLC
jgi:hypothetical protein